MKNGICPKCNGSEVYVLPAKGPSNNFHRIPIEGLASAKLTQYICVDCGYVEEYIDDETKLEQIRQNWIRVKKS